MCEALTPYGCGQSECSQYEWLRPQMQRAHRRDVYKIEHWLWVRLSGATPNKRFLKRGFPHEEFTRGFILKIFLLKSRKARVSGGSAFGALPIRQALVGGDKGCATWYMAARFPKAMGRAQSSGLL
jgi:hypothetical protein